MQNNATFVMSSAFYRVGQKSQLLYCDIFQRLDNSPNVKYSIIL